MNRENRVTSQLVRCPFCETILKLNRKDGSTVPIGTEFECIDCGTNLELLEDNLAKVLSPPLHLLPLEPDIAPKSKCRAPAEQVWVCLDCGNTALGAYSFEEPDCFLHAQLFDMRRLVFGGNGKVLLIKSEEEDAS